MNKVSFFRDRMTIFSQQTLGKLPSRELSDISKSFHARNSRSSSSNRSTDTGSKFRRNFLNTDVLQHKIVDKVVDIFWCRRDFGRRNDTTGCTCDHTVVKRRHKFRNKNDGLAKFHQSARSIGELSDETDKRVRDQFLMRHCF